MDSTPRREDRVGIKTFVSIVRRVRPGQLGVTFSSRLPSQTRGRRCLHKSLRYSGLVSLERGVASPSVRC